MTSQAEGVLIILVDRTGQLLLHLRDDKEGIAYPGAWSMPGGALETAEHPIEAAKRELLEEIGHRVDRLHLLRSLQSPHTMHVFCGGTTFSEADIAVGEGQAFRFFSREEIRHLQPVAPFVVPLLEDFMSSPLYGRCRQDARRR